MRFKKHYLPGITTPILLPIDYNLIDMIDGHLRYINTKTGEVFFDEPLFFHNKNQIFPRKFKPIFANDSIIVILVSPNNKLYLQKRGKNVTWAPSKIDLVSVAGQRRAILVNNQFKKESPEDAALREISEETGVEIDRLKKENLFFLGTHYNSKTNEYQMIYIYKIDITLEELKNYLSKSSSQEVREWFEQDYYQTIKEYFGKKVEKYAGGAEMRPFNFISNHSIKKKLDKFFDSLISETGGNG